jgi:uncharacterized protein
MGLIRLIIFAVVIWMFWRLVKNFQANIGEKGKKDKPKGEIEQSSMVLCQYCSVHVPESDAANHEQLWFCSDKHKEKYLAGGQ